MVGVLIVGSIALLVTIPWLAEKLFDYLEDGK